MKWQLSPRQKYPKNWMNKYSHGGNIRKILEDYRFNPEKTEIIDFSVNLNPLGLSKKVKSSILNNINSVLHYPDVFYKKLKEKIAGYSGIKYENILAGNGSIEFIYLIPGVLSVKKALIPIPTFSEYESAVKITGAKLLFIKTIEKENFRIDIDKIVKNIHQVDIVFLCNPNNPTGYLIPYDEIKFLIEKCEKKGVFLFIDETFIEFTDKYPESSAVKEARNRKNLLVLRSLTKFFSIPGLRIGYIAGNKNLIQKINKFQPPWSVNSIGSEVAKNILEDYEYIKRSKIYIKKERERFLNELTKIGFIKPFNTSANFVLCKLDNKLTSSELFDKLVKKGIIIRDCSNFRGLNNKFIRLAIRRREENDKLIKILMSLRA